jgi:radical SAM protein with 4Fe4S-binding SPASM domain
MSTASNLPLIEGSTLYDELAPAVRTIDQPYPLPELFTETGEGETFADAASQGAITTALEGAEDKTTRFMWLEITKKCQLECSHCYAESGPKGTHGAMGEEDWIQVINDGADIGVEAVQFIGGEPTLNRSLPRLIGHALTRGLQVEVYSNLTHIRPDIWNALSQEGVSLATSYYASAGQQHDSITQRQGSHRRTRANIVEALSRNIPLRVGVIGVEEGQDVQGAVEELQALGIEEARIGIDYLRQVGRGVRTKEPSVDQLCGSCTDGVVAIMPDGMVRPCLFTRWDEMVVGNVKESSLTQVIQGERLRRIREQLDESFGVVDTCRPGRKCGPCVPKR